MYTDVHTHAFHEKIASKALAKLTGHYGVAPAGTGLLKDLTATATAAGISRVFVHTAATAPAQVIPANNWAMELQQHPMVTAFGSLHPDFSGWEQELDRLYRNNIRGVKIHPEFQGFSLDDPKLVPILEAAAGRFLFMVHVGDAPTNPANPSSPRKLAKVLDHIPGLTVIAAHLGGWSQWQEALDHLIGRDIFIDTSSSLAFAPPEVIKTILKRHPLDRVLFGSDWPLHDPAQDIAHLRSLPYLAEKDLEKILTNGSRLIPPLTKTCP